MIKPVKTVVIGQQNHSAIREFPAKVFAAERAELSFRVAGKVEKILVKEGQSIKKGQVLAILDNTQYKLSVAEAKASYERIKGNYVRAQELIKNNYISRKDFDKIRAESLSSKAALDNATTELSYTKLIAPFDGVVAQRDIQKFEQVQAKETVFAIQNASLLELKINVPEKMIKQIQDHEDELSLPVSAYFDDKREKPYPLTVSELSTKADTDTQTFEVTLLMTAPTDVTILPGMTGYVSVDFSAFIQIDGSVHLIASAVVASNDHQAKVWVVKEDNTVHSKSVQVSNMTGESIIITSGLEIGERVVVAGVPFLTEGMKVSLMPQIDQAQ